MRLRKLALTDPAAAFLLPIFAQRAWSSTTPSGDEPLEPALRAQLAAAPPGVEPLLADMLDATPRWRLAGDAEAALAIRILAARQSRVGLPAVLRATCDVDADDADSVVGRALYEAFKDYAPVAMGDMVAFARGRNGELGLLPAYLLTEPLDERAVELALSYLHPAAIRDLSTRGWHMKLVSVLAARVGPRDVARARAELSAAIEQVPRAEDRWIEGDAVWAQAVVGLASAMERLGGGLSPVQRNLLDAATEIDRRAQERQEALTEGAYERELEAANPSTSRIRLVTLASDPLPAVRAAAAGNPQTPRDALGRLAGDLSPDVRCAVAANASTPEEAQERLARDPEVDVRRALAMCRDLYPPIMQTLLRDPDIEVREQLVPSLPTTLLQEAARDTATDVRQAIAWHPAVPAELLDQLARDPDPVVRDAVAAVRDLASRVPRPHLQPSSV